MRLCKPINGGQ